MLAKVNSCAIIGLEGAIIEVEVDSNLWQATGGNTKGEYLIELPKPFRQGINLHPQTADRGLRRVR